jgi:hypothetical protein
MTDWFCVRRKVLFLTAALVIAVGLTTRLPGIDWSPQTAKYLGSVLWGVMVYCLTGGLWRRLRASRVALLASCIAAAVEFSQLWHVPLLDSIRRTSLGVLLIGRFFAWADIAAYLIGITLAAAADAMGSRLKAP